ncbi:MAG: archaeal heat shock protein Hsp20 [Thermoprotei archaeon]
MSRRYRDIFDVFEDMMRQIQDIMDREFRELEREFEELAKSGKAKTYGPYVYGFRVTIGPDGKPVVEEFGNVRTVKGRPTISEEREPLVDVIERNDEVKVIAEVPGVSKENIKVKVLNGEKLVIQATGEDRKYYKEIELPTKVDEKSAKASYKNGVLEVTLKKAKTEEQGTEIKVE